MHLPKQWWPRVVRTILIGGFEVLPVLSRAQETGPASSPVLATHSWVRRALLIGMSRYVTATQHQFGDLHGNNDVSVLRDVLIHNYAFPADAVTVLAAPEKTDRDAILAAMRRFFVEEAQPGDDLFFYYSGHGSQIPDTRKADGWGKTLVPSDYAEDGSRDITEDEIRTLLSECNARKVASITLGFDCCHAGRITRGDTATVRGISGPMRFPGVPIPATRATRSEAPGYLRGGDLKETIILSACGPAEMAKESPMPDGCIMGRFTYQLIQALLTAPPTATYHEVFDPVKLAMGQRYPDQNPEMTETDRHFLSKQEAPRSTRALVRETRQGSGVLCVDRGMLLDATAGSRFDLFLMGTTSVEPADRLAEARIATVHLLESDLVLLGTVSPEVFSRLARGAYAQETHHEYTERRLAVALSASLPGNAATGLRTVLQNDPCVQVTGETEAPDVLILPKLETSPDGTVPAAPPEKPETMEAIRTCDQQQIAQWSVAGWRPATVRTDLEKEYKHWRLRNLNNASNGEGLRVEMRLVPARVTSDDKDDQWHENAGPAYFSGQQRVGEWFTVEVRNTGKLDAHLCLLDLQPDGSCDPLWPGSSEDDVLVKAQSDWHKLWVKKEFNVAQPFQVCPPLGREIFKLLATYQRLSPLDRVVRKEQPFDQVLGPTFVRLWHGAPLEPARSDQAIKSGEWSTATAILQVIP